MKQFMSGILLGFGIGLLVCGLVASSIISDFEYTLTKYDKHINDFYDFTHSYGFDAVQGLINETASFYRTNPLLRQALETFGMGQIGQLLQDVDENFEQIVDMSEDLSTVRSSVQDVRSRIQALLIGGIVLAGAGVAVEVWALKRGQE
ncbi:MAG: hypothetical protein HXS46_11460 [Theionarchaea archaeon]|nr:hypothetical protein [Theionarchaea archaeon]